MPLFPLILDYTNSCVSEKFLNMINLSKKQKVWIQPHSHNHFEIYTLNNFLYVFLLKANYVMNIIKKFLIMKGHREVYQMLLWHSYFIGLKG